MLSDKLQGQFVTAAYLYLDLDAGVGRYSAAGHPPLTHYTATDEIVHDVVENGLILGIMPVAAYETTVLRIAKGDRFLLYTDGVLEAAQDGEEFGAERVKRLIARSVPVDQLCTLLGHEVNVWTRGVAGDDVTIVAVEIA